MGSVDESGRGDLEVEVRRLWSAYAFLRDTDLRQVSGTSRLLHEADVDYLRSRLCDELLELAGVLSGKHLHRTLAEDIVLEGSQVCYWTYLAALSMRAAYEELQPHEQLAPAAEPPEARASLADKIGSVAARLASADEDKLRRLLPRALQMVGLACLTCGLDGRDVVSYDLQQMRARAYMRPYFAPATSGRG